MSLVARQFVKCDRMERVEETQIVLCIQETGENFFVIRGRQPECLLEKVFVLGFAPGEQGHAGKKRRGPVADFKKAFLEGEKVAVLRPSSRFRFIGQTFDVRSTFKDAQIEGTSQLCSWCQA